MALAATEEQLPGDSFKQQLLDVVPASSKDGVASSLEYVRDRVGVPRDLPLAAGRYLRAYLNWGVDVLRGSQ